MKLKKFFLTGSLPIIFFSCNTSENIKKGNEPLLRTDGLYIAINPHSHSYSKDKNGKVEEEDTYDLIRFYNLDSAIIVHYQKLKGESITVEDGKKWFHDFKKLWKYSHDKEDNFQSELFHPKLFSEDSIQFISDRMSGGVRSTSTNYSGKMCKDSLALNFVIYPTVSTQFIPLPPRHQSFIFYPAEGK